jgi:hypothetical protein
MGLDSNAVRLLINAKHNGARFDKTLTLGRQWLILTDSEAAKFLPALTPNWKSLIRSDNFADDFLRSLGAQDLQVMDVSTYEGAQVLHDMNNPIPDHLKGQVDAVIDGGTTEHIFNFPTAIKNCMEMVKVGGQLYSFVPANNYCGHGFYQISPELHFRVLGRENGYRIDRILVSEWGTRSLYEVVDPEDVQARVELSRGTRPVLLLTQATRIADVPIFHVWPQQSDYRLVWHGGAPSRSKWSAVFPALLQPAARKFYRALLSNYGTVKYQRFFRRLPV